MRRVLGLGFLEYVVLSIGALVASVLLFFGLDGHASNGVDAAVADHRPQLRRSRSG